MNKNLAILIIFFISVLSVFLVLDYKKNIDNYQNTEGVFFDGEKEVNEQEEIIEAEEDEPIEIEEPLIGLPDLNEIEKPEDIIIPEEISIIEEENIVEEKKDNLVFIKIPFTSQAPFGDWGDIRQQDGCEEASSIMAMLWLQGIKEISKEAALNKILEIAEFEQEKYGNHEDTSASSTIERILEDYYDYHQARLELDIEVQDIINELEAGNLVIAPFNGRKLGNIYFTSPGPERHMLVIVGYDYVKNEFITNDPGTRWGEGYRYARDTLFSAIRDYSTGFNVPIVGEEKVMIVISRPADI